MTKTKKYTIIGAVVACVIIAAGLVTYCPKRSVKKSLCAEVPALCHCYNNIVDYRLTNRDITILHRIQKEIKKYGRASALEFASLDEIQHLNGLLGVCQLEQMSRQVAPQPAQVAARPAPQPTQVAARPAPQPAPVKKTTTQTTTSTKKK